MPMSLDRSDELIHLYGRDLRLAVQAPGNVSMPVHTSTKPASVTNRTRTTPRSRRTLSAADLFNRPWLITRDGLASLVADYTRSPANAYDEWDDEDEDSDADPNDPKNLPYGLTDDGMACLLVAGPLSNAASWWTTSYTEIATAHAHALANPAVQGICVCLNSPGGEASSALFDLADTMFSTRSQKPCVAVSADSCYSAAYMLASAAAEKIFVTRCGGVGSVGVWTAHVSLAGLLDQAGVVVTLIHSGDKKVDGNPYEDLSDRARADIKAEVDRIRLMFAQSVAQGRACPVGTIMDTEAAIYMADAGCPTMADYVGSMDDALNYLRGMVAKKKAEEPGDKEDYPAAPDSGLEPPAALLPTSPNLVLEDPSGTARTYTQSDVHQMLGGRYSLIELPNPGIPTSVANAANAPANPPMGNVPSPFKPSRQGMLLAGLPALHGQFPNAIAAMRNLRSAASVSTADICLEARKVTLLLAPYNSIANLGSFDERYRPGCFDNGGLSGDLRVLANHAESQSYVLGRVSASTARFWSDDLGVHAEADAPDTTWANDLLVSMRRGDVRDASAGFYILKASYETDPGTGRKTRWIERALLVDGSVESFGAYPGANAQLTDLAQPQQAGASATALPILSTATIPSPALPSDPASGQTNITDHNRNNRARLAILGLSD